jgi:O-acetyl-ADP-ribose deacetylase (regulator of RNase III)
MDVDAVVNAANSTLIGGAASAARSTKQVDQQYSKNANA